MTLIKPFQAIKPELDEITSADVFFGEVKKNYPEFFKAGFFNRMGSESLYIYQIVSEKGTKTGMICRIPVEEYLKGDVVKHENTLAAKEQKMLLLTLERQAMVKPVMLTYPPVKSIETSIKKHIKGVEPTYEVKFEIENERHLFYAISNGQTIMELQGLFEKSVPKTYVADGHHRLATSALLYKRMKKKKIPTETYKYLLCGLFPTNELEIHDYNRVVEFDTFSPMVLMALLSRKFNVQLLEEARKPNNKHEIILAIGDSWFSLIWRPKILKKYSSTVESLDVNLLNEEVLSNIFAVADITTDKRVGYIEGPKGLEGVSQKVNGKENCAAFILPPVTWKEFLDITNAGITLPPKSTWFEPRMKNGVIVYGY